MMAGYVDYGLQFKDAVSLSLGTNIPSQDEEEEK